MRTAAHGLWSTLFGRRSRTAPDRLRERAWTFATALTGMRAATTSAIFIWALISGSRTLLLVGLGTSMVVDFADGLVARSSHKETVIGAQLDGLADRLATVFVIAGAIAMSPGAGAVAVSSLVWLQFGIVDGFLSSQFLRFGLWSPDHFYAIDERAWRLNWSPLAKLASNLPIALLAVGSWLLWPAAALSVVLIPLRISCYPAIKRAAQRQLLELHHAYSPRVTGEPQPSAEVPGSEHGSMRAPARALPQL
jgi:phosphatidylglycerophosphate synthase